MLGERQIRQSTIRELATRSDPRTIPKVLEPRLEGLVRRIPSACSTRNNIMGRMIEVGSVPLVVPVETRGVDEGGGGGIGEERH